MKKLQNYISGKVSLQKERLDRTSDDNLGQQETLTEDSSAEMFSKSYWFGGNEGETPEEPAPDPWLPNMSKTQRIVGFFTMLSLGIFCFVLAGFYAPLIILKARKFVLLYTMGSLFTIGSFAVLWGPYNHMKHIFSYQRLPFTAAYFGTMIGTLYSALWWRSTVFTIIFAALQITALLWYIFSYIPGGTTGLKFFSKLFASACTKTVGRTLPI
ncbi:uncharacterized protein [Clytia hemisphaerica]|uniref:Vesicle transport protein n=1 Tax=Clytia hemisphaerica TaxID=252671 RepID=A0A7M5WXR5_9CNID|eukprot:TCONS_00016094-protein